MDRSLFKNKKKTVDLARHAALNNTLHIILQEIQEDTEEQ